ncbi:IS5 family transposase [Streptomyces sp. 4503]|uniref:IS5 family transposase n=1 Tax=Streptomyces niphimycinicus TaxID=2842201 RepID=A0ABS6CN01_9ACTN|nr:IS5 family transposase [Streptomyces niphimycinicus]MBU3868302.1 IS5 family transposase [Streptomyces niphimycinicus]
MACRDDLIDEQWALIEPFLTSSGRGGQWRDHRQVVNGILRQLRTGGLWRDVPERYGPWKTLHERLRRWTADGTWGRILTHVQTGQADAGELEWVFSIDSSVVRAHQHAAGARKKGNAPQQPARVGGQMDRDLHAWSGRGQPAVAGLCSAKSV